MLIAYGGDFISSLGRLGRLLGHNLKKSCSLKMLLQNIKLFLNQLRGQWIKTAPRNDALTLFGKSEL